MSVRLTAGARVRLGWVGERVTAMASWNHLQVLEARRSGGDTFQVVRTMLQLKGQGEDQVASLVLHLKTVHEG